MSRVRVRIRAPRRSAGIVLYYMLGAIVAFSFACSFAVDYGRVRLAKSQLQAAADAAALAAANAFPNGFAAARAEAVKYANANITDGIATPIDPASDVTFGYWG